MTALRYSINCIGKTADFFLRELPQALKATGVEALLIDQVSPGAETVADFLGIPFRDYQIKNSSKIKQYCKQYR